MSGIQALAGPVTFNVSFSYASLAYDIFYKQMKLFAEKCLAVPQAVEIGQPLITSPKAGLS